MAIARQGRAVALSFEQTRRALAWLFRKRLEKHARAQGLDDLDPTGLPTSLQAIFAPGPPPAETSLDADGLDEVMALVRGWRAGGPAQTVAVVGARGIGKTTWLDQFEGAAQHDDGQLSKRPELIRITVPALLLGADDVCRFVAASCSLAAVDTPEAVVDALAAGPRRIVVVDHCERFALRAMGGLAGHAALTQILTTSPTNVLWVCAWSSALFTHTRGVQRARDVYSHVVELRPWSEARITALLDRRMRAAGYTPLWDDLLFDELSAETVGVDGLRVSERFMRLLWDHCDGNPSDSMHFWLRSLSATAPGEVRVRLFASPDADLLEPLGELSRFVLAAIVVHEELPVAEIARAVGEPAAACASATAWLAARGYLENTPLGWRVSPHWHRAAVRYLRRKHLPIG